MQPLMKCNICKKVFESRDCGVHTDETGHNSYKMMKRKPPKLKGEATVS